MRVYTGSVWSVAYVPSGISSVSGTAPVESTGGSTPTISMHAADGSHDGYLTSSNWSTFNGKQPAGSYVLTSSLGVANGACPLDSGSKVSATYLPSYVDDVIEVTNYAALPGTGETGKIYVTLDTNLTYRWSGTAYVQIDATIGLGETSATAYRGDRGKTAYDHSNATGNPHGATTADIADSTNKRYCTDAQKTVLANTSNTNTGDQDLSGLLLKAGGTMTGAITSERGTHVALSGSVIDCSTGNSFSKTITGTTTFTLSNVPVSGQLYTFLLYLTNGGAYTVNLFSGVKWAAGVDHTLTTSGLDILSFTNVDGGTSWIGNIKKGVA